MSDDWKGGLFVVPSPDSAYERLGHEIQQLAARVMSSRVSSTLQDDLSRLRVERCRMWMRRNGIGAR